MKTIRQGRLDPHGRGWRGWATLLAGACLLSLVVAGLGRASDHEDCLDCHGESDFETERGGRTVSLYVDGAAFRDSKHAGLDCSDCHTDVDPEDLPHEDDLEPVHCGICHGDAQTAFDTGAHGQALKRRAPHAPECRDCHTAHDIRAPNDPKSPTYKMNVPYMCGACHREGAPVSRAYDIGEHNIVDNYSQSIHGVGLFEKGLTVTAACTDCHGSHRVLPHTDPKATISPRNIAKTCMKCHARIEDVHAKIIRGELWETAPGVIPACTDCHLPHRVRKETVAITLSNRDCLDCHESPDLYQVVDGDSISMTVNAMELQLSIHEDMPCVKCHTDVNPRAERPCETSGRAECANCHEKIAKEYEMSGHGQAFIAGLPEAPNCITCHGDHEVQSHRDQDSPTFRSAVPALCGECHRVGGDAELVPDLSQSAAFADYSKSVHGRGLSEKGLLPSAICIDCHSSHMVLKHSDPRSTVHEKNIPATCATCHQGIYKQYITSVHYSPDEGQAAKLPNCSECHSSHTIQQVEKDQFMLEVTDQCGSCHAELASSYLDTMHGKAYQLGYVKAAKCSDCHGQHAILPVDDPHSTVGVRNIVETCRTCHEDATQRFTGYLTHATHHDPVKYPILYYTYWSMTFLLVGVFSFFGVHTLLWLPRSFRQLNQHRKETKLEGDNRHYIRRFSDSQRITHVFVIVSFLSLALTGMMLRFSYMPWAEYLAGILGGVRVAGSIHRFAAVITFGYFLFHISSLVRLKRRQHMSWKELTLGKGSMMFNVRDIRDFGATIRWFLGRGPRPEYGRWTYWEKFDYLAVFWGVAIIGASGLLLWFPEFFTRFLPGWLINVATIIHSDEALLAVGFIFTIHFFNTHLRPEVFPMDTVVFTGVIPVKEYKKDRPNAYAELKTSGQLRKRVVTKTISRRWAIAVRIFGSTALVIGLCLVGLIIYSMLFGYRQSVPSHDPEVDPAAENVAVPPHS